MITKQCVSCGAEMAESADFCPKCGARQIAETTKFCESCGEKISIRAEICPKCGAPQESASKRFQTSTIPIQTSTTSTNVNPVTSVNNGKSKTTAGLLALFLGGLGVHKFYLGQMGLGILYLVLCETFIPAIIGFIEGIILLTMSDEKFQEKYPAKK